MYFIGVDLGTSAVKLLLMEESGKICNIVSKEYPLFFPHPGWSEQNPEDWYTQSMAGMKELTEGIDRSQVAGISFGGQMHGLVTLDDQDQVIRPAHGFITIFAFLSTNCPLKYTSSMVTLTRSERTKRSACLPGATAPLSFSP